MNELYYIVYNPHNGVVIDFYEYEPNWIDFENEPDMALLVVDTNYQAMYGHGNFVVNNGVVEILLGGYKHAKEVELNSLLPNKIFIGSNHWIKPEVAEKSPYYLQAWEGLLSSCKFMCNKNIDNTEDYISISTLIMAKNFVENICKANYNYYYYLFSKRKQIMNTSTIEQIQAINFEDKPDMYVNYN